MIIYHSKDDMEYLKTFPVCKNCVSLKDFYDKKGNISSRSIKYNKGSNRIIYFAPVGNQFNFGFYNNSYTPKIVIMGMTTSPSARDNFYNTVNKFKDNNFQESIQKACLINTFNSDGFSLLLRLSKILNIAGIWKMIGINSNIELKYLFLRYKDDNLSADEKIVLKHVYFTQYIPCCSVSSQDDRRAPKKEDIDDKHEKCISYQKTIFESFKEKVQLLITFSNTYTFPIFNDIKQKCINHIPISHPASSFGWNPLDKMITQEIFEEYINSKVLNHIYEKQVRNCYKQIQILRNVI